MEVAAVKPEELITEEENGIEAAAADAASNQVSSVSGSDSKKKKRKEDKSYEYVLRALSSLNTPEEKLAALCRKYADLNEETRTLKEKFRGTQKFANQVAKEKEQLQNEHGKVVLAKDRLENLCREFQKQNKLISDESVNRAKEAEEKRKEVSNKFQTTLTEIRVQMNDYHAMNDKLREENRKLSERLKSLMEHYEQREQQLEKMQKTKELEHQLAEAKLEHVTCSMQQETIRFEKEQGTLLQEVEKGRERIAFLENRESILKGEISFYQNKYEDFQETLTKSNEVFNNFKEEMEKMSRRLRKVEKETVVWKQKFENSNRTALQLAEEKTKNENELRLLRTKVSKLEELCRVLQAERRSTGPQSTALSSSSEPAARPISLPKASPSPEPSTEEASEPPLESAQSPPGNTEGKSESVGSPSEGGLEKLESVTPHQADAPTRPSDETEEGKTGSASTADEDEQGKSVSCETPTEDSSSGQEEEPSVT